MNGHFPLGEINPWRYFFILGFILASLFTLVNDDETRHVAEVFLQWQLQVHSGSLFFIATHLFLTSQLSGLNSALKLLVSAFIASLFYAPVSLLFDVYWLHDTDYTLAALVQECSDMIPTAMFSWLVVNLPWLTGLSLQRRIPLPETPPDTPTLAIARTIPISPPLAPLKAAEVIEPETKKLTAFLQLATVNSVDEIVYLKAELHYLKVVAHDFEKLILFNLKDAISALAEADEQHTMSQTHRSYWVNRAYIRSVKSKGRQATLLMSNDDKVLVSRNNMQKVKAWF